MSQRAEGDVIVHIDLDTATPGIQTNIVAGPGQTVCGALIIEVTNGTQLSNYNLRMRYRTDELDLGPPTFTDQVAAGLNRRFTMPAGWVTFTPPENTTATDGPLAPPDPTVGNAGEFEDISAAAFPGPFIMAPAMGSLSVQVFEFKLTTTAAADAGLIDVIPTLARPIDYFLDENNMLIDLEFVTLNGASVITAVPEPSTWAILGIGAICIGRRRKRRRSRMADTTTVA